MNEYEKQLNFMEDKNLNDQKRIQQLEDELNFIRFKLKELMTMEDELNDLRDRNNKLKQKLNRFKL